MISVNGFNYAIYHSTRSLLHTYLNEGDYQGGFSLLKRNEHIYGQLYKESGLWSWYEKSVQHLIGGAELTNSIDTVRRDAFSSLHHQNNARRNTSTITHKGRDRTHN